MRILKEDPISESRLKSQDAEEPPPQVPYR